MELADYLRVLRRRWWMVLLAVTVCTTGAAAFSYLQAPSYTTTTRLLVSGGQGNDNAVAEMARRQLAGQRAIAYAQLVDTGPADAAAVRAANVGGAQVSTTATADGTSPFITIVVVAGSGQVARAVANAYVTVLPGVIEELERPPSSSTEPVITTLEMAPLPTKPTSPDPPRDILVGFVLGFVLGVASALVREALDARLRDTTEVEKLAEGLLLGAVPREGGDLLVSRSRPRSARAEAYRHVRTNLEFTTPGGLPRSVVITSPAPSEGKSSLSANLALVAARSGRNVILVDADLRKPSIAKYFGIKPAVGLADVLAGDASLSEAVVQVPGERLWLLPAGTVPKFPSELVGSDVMAELIEHLEQHIDLVVIDTPPVLPVSDALVVGVNAGGVVLVARMGETKRAALKRAIQAVRNVDANLLGVVANAVVLREEAAYRYGYGYIYGGKGYTTNRKDPQAPIPEVAPARRRLGLHADAPPTRIMLPEQPGPYSDLTPTPDAHGRLGQVRPAAGRNGHQYTNHGVSDDAETGSNASLRRG